jgi:hypothetical protein
VSAVARGIAEADNIGITANAQAATPISNKRFISSSPWDRVIAATSQCSADRSVPLPNQAIANATARLRRHHGSQKRN